MAVGEIVSPTQRTLAALRKQGITCGIVERWIAQARKRIDLFNIIDIIAITGDKTIGVQSCGQAHSEHWKKLTIDEAEKSRLWLESPHRSLELWSWRKLKVKRGGKAMVWTPRVAVITLGDLQCN